MLALGAIYSHPRARVLYGGGAGSGKTYLLPAAHAHFHISNYRELGVRGLRTLIMAATYNELETRIIPEFEQHWRELGEVRRVVRAGGLGFHFYHKPLGVIYLRNAQKLIDLRGLNVGMVSRDELSQTSQTHKGENSYHLMTSVPLRWPGKLLSRPFLAASNWDGPGMTWMRQVWWDRTAFDPQLRKVYGNLDPKAHFYVQAKLTDNPIAEVVEDYLLQMQALPDGALKDSRLYARPSAPTGAAFGMFRRGLQTFRFRDVFPKGLPEGGTIFMGLDWGSASPFCASWNYLTPCGRRIYTYRLAYQSGLTDPEQCDVIRAMTASNERVAWIRYDPAMAQQRKNNKTGALLPSPLMTYQRIVGQDPRFGPMLPGDNSSRILGVACLRSMLSRGPHKEAAGVPDWFIEESLSPAIGEIEGAVYRMIGNVWTEDIVHENDHFLTQSWYCLRQFLPETEMSYSTMLQAQEVAAIPLTLVDETDGDYHFQGYSAGDF